MPITLNTLCSMLLLCFVSTLSAAQEVVIFSDNDYRPVIFSDHKGYSAGILAHVVQHFATDSGTPVKIKLYPWKRTHVSAEKGLGGMVGLPRTARRMALFDYSVPIYDDSINVVVLAGHALPFNTPADLEGKKIGGNQGRAMAAKSIQLSKPAF